jgi:hypothetical protein
MPAAWPAEVQPAGAVAEPAVERLPRRAVAAQDAVVQRPAALAVAEPRRAAVSGARPRPEAEVASGSPAAEVLAAAPAARRIAMAP